MAGIYLPSNGINQQVKKIFTPVNGVNHEVKEAWTNVEGVNRKVFSSVDWTVEIGKSHSGAYAGFSCYKLSNSTLHTSLGFGETTTCYEGIFLTINFSEPILFTGVRFVDTKVFTDNPYKNPVLAVAGTQKLISSILGTKTEMVCTFDVNGSTKLNTKLEFILFDNNVRYLHYGLEIPNGGIIINPNSDNIVIKW